MNKTKIVQIYKILSHTQPTFEETDNDWITHGLNSTPFKLLVSVAISTMTHDKRTVKACIALYEKISTPQELIELEDEELATLIKPAAHYNRKTKSLKKMCHQLIEQYDGEIPQTKEELMELSGIGRKCADIMMHFSVGEPSIAVDTHVHRVLNRLGVVNTRSSEETADVINTITPQQYKQHAHEWLIGHGMEICKARAPKCKECALRDWCQYNQTRAIG